MKNVKVNVNKANVQQYLFVIKELSQREIKRKYARSYLGIIWSVLNPLLTMVVMSVIFTQMFQRSIENYPIYLLTGQLIWSFFSTASNTSMSAIVDNRLLLTRVKTPMIVFPLSRVVTALINMGYSFVAYIMMLFVFRIRWGISCFLIIYIVFFLSLFTMGVSFALTALYVFFADIKHLYGIVLTLWMYLSVIFYPLDCVPDYLQQFIIYCNPLYCYVSGARKCMMYAALPSGLELAQMFIWGLGMFAAGIFTFYRAKDGIMQKI